MTQDDAVIYEAEPVPEDTLVSRAMALCALAQQVEETRDTEARAALVAFMGVVVSSVKPPAGQLIAFSGGPVQARRMGPAPD